MSEKKPDPAHGPVVIEGLVCEHRGATVDKQYVLTDDDGVVYPQYLLQWFVGKRVRIVVTDAPSDSHGQSGFHRTGRL